MNSSDYFIFVHTVYLSFSNFNEQLVYENIVLVCIFIHSSLIITGGPFVTSAALHVMHAGHGYVVHVVYMMHVAWEYNTCTCYTCTATCTCVGENKCCWY